MARRNRIKAEQAALPKEIQPAVIIESLDQEGRGVARVDGKTIFIDGALPTEKVTYQLTRDRKSTRLNSSHLRLSRMPSSA